MSRGDHKPDNYEKLFQDAWKRLSRLQIKKHHLKANLARVEAQAQEEAAATIGRLLNEFPDNAKFASALEEFVEEFVRRFEAPTAPAVKPSAPLSPPAIGADVKQHEAPLLTAEPVTSRPSPHIAPSIERQDDDSPIPSVGDGLVNRTRKKARHPRVERRSGRKGKPRSADGRQRTALAPRSLGASAQVGRRKESWLRSHAWLTSVLVHIALLVVLGALTFAALQETEPSLAATIGSPDETYVAEIVEVEIDQPEPVESFELESLVPMEASPPEAELTTPWQSVESGAALATTAVGEFAFAELPLGAAALLEAGGDASDNGSGSDGESDTSVAAASFFGAEAQASRIAFVVDNSNSMDEGRFETALAELARSVHALSPQQSFYVVLYSDTAYGLFHPLTVEELVPATRENKARLRQWLTTVQMCTGGRLVDAMRLAARVRPQVVYLLSDGVIGDYPVSYLTEERDWDFTIHTIGMTVPDRRAAQKLMAIAEANDGVFRAVGVTPLAREMSARNPVKKNRHRGPVWGLKLPLNAND